MTRSVHLLKHLSSLASVIPVLLGVALVTPEVLAETCAKDRAYLYDRVPDPCRVDGVCVPNAKEFGYYKVHWNHWPTEVPSKEESTTTPTGPTELPGVELPNPKEEGLRQPAKPTKSKETSEEATDADASPPPPPELGDRPPAPSLPGTTDRNLVPPGEAPFREPSPPKPELPKIEPPKTPELPNPTDSFDDLFPSPLSPGSKPTTNDKSTSIDPEQSRLGGGLKAVPTDHPPTPPNYLAGPIRVSPLRPATLKRGEGRSTARLEGEGTDLTQNTHHREGNPLRIAEEGSPAVIRTVSHEEVVNDVPPAVDVPVRRADVKRENPLRRNRAGN